MSGSIAPDYLYRLLVLIGGAVIRTKLISLVITVCGPPARFPLPLQVQGVIDRYIDRYIS